LGNGCGHGNDQIVLTSHSGFDHDHDGRGRGRGGWGRGDGYRRGYSTYQQGYFEGFLQSYPFVRGNLAPSGYGTVHDQPGSGDTTTDSGGDYVCAAPDGGGTYTCAAGPGQPAQQYGPGGQGPGPGGQQQPAPDATPTPWVVPSAPSNMSALGLGPVPLATSLLSLAAIAAAYPIVRRRRRTF